MGATLDGVTADPAVPSPSPVEFVVLSDAERWQEDADVWWAEIAAEHPDAARPDIVLVREVTMAEWATVRVECLHGLGFPQFFVGSGNSVEAALIESQRLGADVAQYTCGMQCSTRSRCLGADDGVMPSVR